MLLSRLQKISQNYYIFEIILMTNIFSIDYTVFSTKFFFGKKITHTTKFSTSDPLTVGNFIKAASIQDGPTIPVTGLR